MSGHETTDNGRVELLQSGQRLEAVQTRHADIQENQGNLPTMLLIKPKDIVAVCRHPDGEPELLEHHLQEVPHGRFVVRDQDTPFRFPGSPGSNGSTRLMHRVAGIQLSMQSGTAGEGLPVGTSRAIGMISGRSMAFRATACHGRGDHGPGLLKGKGLLLVKYWPEEAATFHFFRRFSASRKPEFERGTDQYRDTEMTASCILAKAERNDVQCRLTTDKRK
jgi:hypothetical protein